MDYVFDFMRLLGGGRGDRGARRGRRGTPGIVVQLRLVFYGLLFGLMMPVIRQIDWSLPAGFRIEWPHFGIAWPAGGFRVPGGWGQAAEIAPVVPAAIAAAAKARAGVGGAAEAAGSATAAATATGGGRFTICGSGRRIDCMVDGDTFWMGRTKIRIADIDTPETHPPRCAAEARAGHRATLRMQALLNAGPFTLVPIRRDVDRYGRKLRVVERGGASLGAVLVREGLARDYGGGKRAGWCGWAARGAASRGRSDARTRCLGQTSVLTDEA